MFRRVYILVLFMALLACAGKAFSQLNESDSAAFHFRLQTGANRQTGNVDMLALRGKADMLLRFGEHLFYKTQNNYQYQEFFKRKADEDINSRHYVYYRPRQRVYPFAMCYINTNFRRKVDYRYFVGAGATWQLVRLTKHALKLSASVVYEQALFRGNMYNESAYNGSNHISIVRPTVYLFGKHRIGQTGVQLWYDAYWQIGADAVKNYRSQADIGLDISLGKNFGLNLLYTYMHEQVVIKGIKTYDGLLTAGLSYQLKK